MWKKQIKKNAKGMKILNNLMERGKFLACFVFFCRSLMLSIAYAGKMNDAKEENHVSTSFAKEEVEKAKT